MEIFHRLGLSIERGWWFFIFSVAWSVAVIIMGGAIYYYCSDKLRRINRPFDAFRLRSPWYCVLSFVFVAQTIGIFVAFVVYSDGFWPAFLTGFTVALLGGILVGIPSFWVLSCIWYKPRMRFIPPLKYKLFKGESHE